METCIQNGALKMDRNLDNVVVSVRLRGADAARFWRIMDAAKNRNPYIDRTNVIRELLGLDPPAVLTVKEIQHFRGYKDEQPPIIHVPVMGETSPETRRSRKAG